MPKRKPYKQKHNAIHITLYDPAGEVLSPVAKEEAENCCLEVAINHKLILNIAET